MRAGSFEQALVAGTEGFEQLKLAVAREDLVVGLDVPQDGSGNGAGRGERQLRAVQARVKRDLPQPELAEHGAPQPGAERRRHGQPVARSHRLAEHAHAGLVRDPLVREGRHRPQPVPRHPGRDPLDALIDDPLLVDVVGQGTGYIFD